MATAGIGNHDRAFRLPGPHRTLTGAMQKIYSTDDFLLIPNPRTCDPKRDYRVVFRAQRLDQGRRR